MSLYPILEILKLEFFNRLMISQETDVVAALTTPKVVFISLCDVENRAQVVKGTGNTFEKAWQSVEEATIKCIENMIIEPSWYMVDYVTDVSEYTLLSFMKYFASHKHNYFREGIAFDNQFKISFLEQEVNSNAFFHYNEKTNERYIVWNNINFYMKNSRGYNLVLDETIVKKIYTFKTKSFFYEAGKIYSLCDENLAIHRRKIDSFDESFLLNALNQASEYVTSLLDENGKYIYGYFPSFDKLIEPYNNLRHASTTYSLLEVYETTGNKSLIEPITKALDYLVNQCFITKLIDHSELGFIIEHSYDNEIKLGANATAILAICKYTSAFEDMRYMYYLELLARGLTFFQNSEGKFVHVLNESDLSVKESFRIIYYEGEAVYAFVRTYLLTNNSVWLNHAQRSFNFFLSNDYWKYHDHWLSYASYELFKITHNTELVEFNLKNATQMINYSQSIVITFPTLLELFMASLKLVEYCEANLLAIIEINMFNIRNLEMAAHHRAKCLFNGFMYPEVAMFFKRPSKLVNAFYTRNHSFRVRIDDIAHNLSGLSNYYIWMQKKGGRHE